MKKIQLYITDLQEKRLIGEKEVTGAKKAEIIRRALDQYFSTKEQGGEDKQ